MNQKFIYIFHSQQPYKKMATDTISEETQKNKQTRNNSWNLIILVISTETS